MCLSPRQPQTTTTDQAFCVLSSSICSLITHWSFNEAHLFSVCIHVRARSFGCVCDENVTQILFSTNCRWRAIRSINSVQILTLTSRYHPDREAHTIVGSILSGKLHGGKSFFFLVRAIWFGRAPKTCPTPRFGSRSRPRPRTVTSWSITWFRIYRRTDSKRRSSIWLECLSTMNRCAERKVSQYKLTWNLREFWFARNNFS